MRAETRVRTREATGSGDGALAGMEGSNPVVDRWAG